MKLLAQFNLNVYAFANLIEGPLQERNISKRNILPMLNGLCRNLRTQHRIRLHINFFISFILSNLLDILWTVLVTYDKISNPQAWCKLLSFLKLYFKSTNYAWMFCEGFYLYRLIANAFSPPKRLLCIYLAGWGIPFTYCTTYAVLRLLIANGSCWAISMGDKEWIIYAPNLACLVGFVVALIFCFFNGEA
ncbi:CALRL-like protein [Mya arenaria]|uniref:CALRL-like protein n=1 Tax=Mya arenaria TaxID=6604 RepID=A0ABY7DC50_MYAAR|nr:CALRL-like protein [Mya arenaria]